MTHEGMSGSSLEGPGIANAGRDGAIVIDFPVFAPAHGMTVLEAQEHTRVLEDLGYLRRAETRPEGVVYELTLPQSAVERLRAEDERRDRPPRMVRRSKRGRR